MAQSKQEWKAKRTHTVTLPSSTEVDIAVPNLIDLLKAGDVPNALVPFAVQAVKIQEDESLESKVEKVKEAGDFANYLIAITVVDPADLSPEDIAELPQEDVDMVLEFAMRQRDTDAVGHQLGGLEKSDQYRRFRRESISDALSLDV